MEALEKNFETHQEMINELFSGHSKVWDKDVDDYFIVDNFCKLSDTLLV